MEKGIKRCWQTSDPLHIRYHDKEWGVPLHDDRLLFEFLALDGFQAGLSWWLILKKREFFRQAFDQFDPAIVANYDLKKIKSLMALEGIIRNKFKIESAVTNAKQFLKVQKEFGSFNDFIWQFVNGRPIQNTYSSLANLPFETVESQTISKALRKRGFKFVGPVICYAYMQSVGMVNDHLIDCFRHEQVKRLNTC